MTVVFGQQATTTTTPTETPTGEKVIPPSTTVTKFIDDTGLTINYVPPGWTVIDHDNTNPEIAAVQQDSGIVLAAVLCPPYSAADTSNMTYMCASPNYGQVQVWYAPAMDKNEYIVRDATEVNPETGLLELNITAQNLLDYTTNPLVDMIVQNKTVPVNVTLAENGTSRQVPALQVLFTSPTELILETVRLNFVDQTTGYQLIVVGPVGTPDLRGEPIPIHGIGLDNLPPVMAECMQIINSVSITRR